MVKRYDFFLPHLDELRPRFRRCKGIHRVCDNAVFHVRECCRKVRECLKRWGHRIRLHFLPTYARPVANLIELVWWHLHEEITRNHCRKDIDKLLDLFFDW